MKEYTLKTLIVLLMILCFNNLNAQFTKKMEWNLQWGIHNVGKKEIPLPDATLYDIGSNLVPTAKFGLWYNIDQNLSAGINLVGAYYIADLLGTEDENSYEDDFKMPLYESYHCSGGIGAKYNFFVRKKLRAYGKANLLYTMNIVNQQEYYYVTSIEDPSKKILYFVGSDDHKSKIYKSIGAEINVGMKTYFSNFFGMVFEAGYLNNGYYKGPVANFGFFFDFKTN